jgi:polysaccharide pyruvyl transferase WcaK-like protein
MTKKIFLIKNEKGNNSGDGLYTSKTKMLFKKLGVEIFESCDVRDDLSIYLEKIYENKNISTSGGPLIYDDFYKNLYSIDKINLSRSNMLLFGCGLPSGLKESSRFKLNEGTKDVFLKSKVFCRDIISYKYMKHNNLSPYYSGCSTWFNGGDIVSYFKEKSDKICLSFWTNPTAVDKKMVKAVMKTFPNSEIKCIFNCGFNDETNSKRRSFSNFLKFCKSKGISCYSCKSSHKDLEDHISKSDMHIGMRLHAHLYAISKGIKSVLVQVDLRGVGQTKSLATENTDLNIKNFSDRLLIEKIKNSLNSDYTDTIKAIEERYSFLKNNFVNFLE